MIDHSDPVSTKKPDMFDEVFDTPSDKAGAWLLGVVGSAMDGVVILDAARRIVLMNNAAEIMFCCNASEVAGQHFDMLLAPRARAEHSLALNRFAASRGEEKASQRTPIFLEGQRTNGEAFAISAAMSRVSVHGERFLVLSLRESGLPVLDTSRQSPGPVARRKRAVSSQQASEVEKRRVSKELYDDLGQRLSVLKLDMDWLEKSLGGTDKLSPVRIAQMQGLLDNIILRTKTIASSLRPPLLDDFGLLPAVTWMVDTFRKKTSILCTFESNGMASRPGDPIESAIFRVVQEGLLNIERHAVATHVKIVIWHDGQRLDVQIEDNGVGMVAGCENKPGCFGLIAMQERIYTLGGTINITNIAPQGVAIRASVPVDSTHFFAASAS